MGELIKHPEFGEIRTVMRKGEPWFVNQDLCSILGLQRSDRIASQFLDDDEKGLQKMSTPGGAQEMLVVNESGMYALIMRSNKPAAKKFRKWVTSEVLPAIRRDGYYFHPDYLGKKELKQLAFQHSEAILRYLPEGELLKVAKKYGVAHYDVASALAGHTKNNAIVQECQRRALVNKEQEINAYHPTRMREVVGKLNR